MWSFVIPILPMVAAPDTRSDGSDGERSLRCGNQREQKEPQSHQHHQRPIASMVSLPRLGWQAVDRLFPFALSLLSPCLTTSSGTLGTARVLALALHPAPLFASKTLLR